MTNDAWEPDSFVKSSRIQDPGSIASVDWNAQNMRNIEKNVDDKGIVKAPLITSNVRFSGPRTYSTFRLLLSVISAT